MSDLSIPRTFAPLPNFPRLSDEELVNIANDRTASLGWRLGARDELQLRDLADDHADLTNRI